MTKCFVCEAKYQNKQTEQMDENQIIRWSDVDVRRRIRSQDWGALWGVAHKTGVYSGEFVFRFCELFFP